MARLHRWPVLSLFVAFAGHAGPSNLLPNPSFELGKAAPEGWTLTGGKGAWERSGRAGARSVSVTGNGKDMVYWQCQAPPLKPGRTYRVSFALKRVGSQGGGCAFAGPAFAFRTYTPDARWVRHSFVFTPPDNATDVSIRFGEWHRPDTVVFDDVSLAEVHAVHCVREGIALGAGERVRGRRYSFEPKFGYEGSNYSRCLHAATASFNSNRWVFGPGSHVVYRHQVGAAVIRSAEVRVTVGHHVSGTCWVECSRDGQQWLPVGKLGGLGEETFELPKQTFPSRAVCVRLRSLGAHEAVKLSAPGSFQVHAYAFSAELATEQHEREGSTRFLDIHKQCHDLAVEVTSLGELLPGEAQNVRMSLRNNTHRRMALTLDLSAEGSGAADGSPRTEKIADAKTVTLDPKAERKVSVPYALRGAGDFVLRLSLRDAAEPLYEATSPFTVPSLYDSTYGHWLGEGVDAQWWWCEGTYKVSRERPAPLRATAKPVTLAAARGEYEPVQIVLRPRRDLQAVKLAVQSSDARWTGLAKAHLVAYHYVHRPTHQPGCVGWWPDAIPAYEKPFAAKAGHNQPIWLLVKVPHDCPSGDHDLRLTITGRNMDTIRVPIKVHVFDFALPAKPHLESAFGLGHANIRRYHNLRTREAERQVWDLYMQSFREHRMAPYDFAPFDPIRTEFEGVTWQAGQIVQEAAAEGKHCLKVVDDSPVRNLSASTAYQVPIEPGAVYRVSWRVRTEKPGQKLMVWFGTYDRDGRWIPHHNIIMRHEGTGGWDRAVHTIPVSERSPNAASVRLNLLATEWQDSGEPLGTAWFDDVAIVKQGTDVNLVRNPGFEPDADPIKPVVDFSAWDKQAEKYLDGYGFTTFRLRLQGMGGGTFHSRRAGRIGSLAQGSAGYRRVFRDYCQQLQQHLQERGWLRKAYIYWFDEPAPKDYDFVRAGMEEIKLAGPKLRRMLTEEPVEPLFGAVDLWCPVLHKYSPPDCQARQKRGEAFWWYVCCGPHAPYPTMFIDANAIDLRMWVWMSWKWRVQGILVWSINYWTSPCAFPPPKIQNPWEDPMAYVSGYGRPAGYVGYWGNGAGHFLYPPNRDVAKDKREYLTGPVSSIRWEMLREGLEDYEYFWLLRAAVANARAAKAPATALAEAEKLLQIPRSIVEDLTLFTRDPQPLYAHRRAIAEAIERLANAAAK